MGISIDFHLLPLGHNYVEPKIILLFDNSDSERVSGNSLKEGTSYFGSLEAFLSNVGGEVNRAEVLMPPRIFFEEEI